MTPLRIPYIQSNLPIVAAVIPSPPSVMGVDKKSGRSARKQLSTRERTAYVLAVMITGGMRRSREGIRRSASEIDIQSLAGGFWVSFGKRMDLDIGVGDLTVSLRKKKARNQHMPAKVAGAAQDKKDG